MGWSQSSGWQSSHGWGVPVVGGGANLLTNGDFSSNTTTGWTAFNSTLSAAGGQLTITYAADFPGTYQVFTTVNGQTYNAQVTAVDGAGGKNIQLLIKDGNNPANTTLGSSATSSSNGEVLTASFTAASTQATFFVVNGSGGAPSFILDDASVV